MNGVHNTPHKKTCACKDCDKKRMSQRLQEKHPMVEKLTPHEKVMLCLASGCEMEFEPHPTDTGRTIVRPKNPVAITWDGKGYLVMEASKP